MAKLRRKRVLAAKVETTPGTAESLTATEAVFNVFDVSFQSTMEFIEREGQSSFAPLPGVLGGMMGQVSFSCELTPGSGAVPSWASTFLPACGLKNTTGTFTPCTEAPGTNVKTLTIAAYEDGVKKILSGCAGNAVFQFEAGKPIRVEFTFTGKWGAPTDVAILAPTYPTLPPLRFVSSGIELNGDFTPKVNMVTIDLGNNVVLREDSSDATGFSTGIITNRRITGTIDPESQAIATKDFFGEWLGYTEQAFEIALVSGTIGITFAAPKLQFTNVQTADRNLVQVENLDFQLNRSAAAGDDEISIAFDSTV